MSEEKDQNAPDADVQSSLALLSGTADYTQLAKAFEYSFDHAANPKNKGSQRHSKTANGRIPYEHQAITVLSDMFGLGGLHYQACKKLQESQRMEPEAALQELRGAMVYIATAMNKINKDNGGKLF